MSKSFAIGGVLTVFVIAPVWYYILFQVLSAIQASELTWFLFWVYVPLSMLASILVKIAEAK